jgi:hypothetical protein
MVMEFDIWTFTFWRSIFVVEEENDEGVSQYSTTKKIM